VTAVRHVLVVRAAVVLALALAAACVLFAWSVRREHVVAGAPAPDAAETDAETAFGTHCAACHTWDELRAALPREEDRARAAVSLLEFLDEHGTASAAEDRAIVLRLLAGP
jgi:mono/diheme cytochrome c family protein